MKISSLLQNKIIFKFKLDFRFVSFVFLFIFGFYGWGAPNFNFDNSNLNFAMTYGFLVVVTIGLYKIRSAWSHVYRLTFSFFDVAVLMLFLALFTTINSNQLTDSLTVDEIAYAWVSQLHSYVISINYATTLAPGLGTWPAHQVMQAISVLMLLGTLFGMYLMNKVTSDFRFMTISLLILFSLRLVISLIGGNEGHHSPLQNIYFYFWSSLLGIQHWVFRLALIFLFAGLSFFLYKMLLSHTKKHLMSFILSLLVITVPLLQDMSLTVEIAAWTFIISSLYFLYFASRKFVIPENSLLPLALCTYFRMNLFALFFATVITYYVQNKKSVKVDSGFVSSILVSIPSLYFSMKFRLDGSLSQSTDYFDRALSGLSSIKQSVMDSHSLIFVIISFLVLGIFFTIYKKARVFILLYSLANALLFVIFTSPETSFHAKYLVEWGFAPLFSLGLLLINLQPKLRFVAFAILITINAYGISSQVEVEKRFRYLLSSNINDFSSVYSSMPRLPMDYSEAYNFVSQENLNCLSVGPVYSMFPEVLSGFNLDYVISGKNLRDSFLERQLVLQESWLEVSSPTLESADVNCVVVGAIQNLEKANQSLYENGWSLVGVFENTRYQTNVTVFVR